MLDFRYDMRPNSRLSCRIVLNDKLDRLVVRIPDKQALRDPETAGLDSCFTQSVRFQLRR
jgi:hypothetical protein